MAVSALSSSRFDLEELFRTWQAKPDADNELDRLSPVLDFFWEVLCQGKVIRERPLPGLAHAFVFWGFCALRWLPLITLLWALVPLFIATRHLAPFSGSLLHFAVVALFRSPGLPFAVL